MSINMQIYRKKMLNNKNITLFNKYQISIKVSDSNGI